MLATHVDSHDLVIARTCPSALQSASFFQAATGQTAAQWGEHSLHQQHRIRTEHATHSAKEVGIIVLKEISVYIKIDLKENRPPLHYIHKQYF